MRLAYLGDTARGSSNPSMTAWKDFGEDIDGLVTDEKSSNVCMRAGGSPSSVQADGNGGIDNSFGANILPIIQNAGSVLDPSSQYTAAIATGQAHSMLFDLHVNGQGASFVFDVAAPLGKPAMFDASEIWRPSAYTMSSGAATANDFQPTFVPDGSGGFTFTSGRSKQRVLLLVHVGGGLAMPIPIDRLQVKMQVKPGTLAGSVGVLSGVIPTEVFIDMFRQLAGGISKSLCGGSFDGIAQQIRQTQDILLDGTNAPGVPCNGISFGMGFEPSTVQIGSPVNETPVMQTCP